MKSLKLTADFLILAIAVIWPVVHSDLCGENGFHTLENTNLPGGTEYPSEDELDCKQKCFTLNECTGADWNSADSTCRLHFETHFEKDESVTHYLRCGSISLPVTEDPLTAGFPAIDRSHTYHLTESSGFSYPIIIMQPPDASVAGFSDATVDNVEIYLKSEGRVTFSATVGLARPKGNSVQDGFELLSSGVLTFGTEEPAFNGKRTLTLHSTQNSPVVRAQPGDAIYLVLSSNPDDAYGVPYDIGTPDVCGVTSMGTLEMAMPPWTIVQDSLRTLDECWMMSVSFNLTPQD